jgi:tRNA-splicing ligase RtcB
MPIGGVLATNRVVVPNAVGVDIGCGMAAVKTNLFYYNLPREKLGEVMALIRGTVPMGLGQHQALPQDWEGFNRAPEIPVIQRQIEAATRQLGTLGAGNHFIEIQADDDGVVWIMVHSGSRNFGLKVAGEYNNRAKFLTEKWHARIPNDELAFLPIETNEGHEYLEAMQYSLEFAKANRAVMVNRVLQAIEQVVPHMVPLTAVDVHHNYAAWEHHFGQDVIVHRKGATFAGEGAVGIIPGSMGGASYIVRGLGNPLSFNSCSHGAGRRMSRRAAKRDLDLETEQRKMLDMGVVGGPRTIQDLDEAPGAYKDIELVMAAQSDLVVVTTKLHPLASLKG